MYIQIFPLHYTLTGPLIEKADCIFMSKDVAREKGYDTKEKAVVGLADSCKQRWEVDGMCHNDS